MSSRLRAIVFFVLSSILCFSLFQNCGSEFKSDSATLQSSNNYQIICEGDLCDSLGDVQEEEVPLNNDFSPVKVESQSCLFDGEPVLSGQSVVAYLFSSGESCISQTRVCGNGVLSGEYNYSSCLKNSPKACLFNGKTIPNNQAVMAYFESLNNQGQKECLSESRLCEDGQLSGTYTLANCIASTSEKSCLFNGMTIAHDEKINAFKTSSVQSGQSCELESRLCVDGQLSGNFLFSNCSVDVPKSCLFQDLNIPHLGSVLAYQNLSASNGQSCVSESRTCNNGQLSGSFKNQSCNLIANQKSCQLGEQVIPHGGQVLAYNTSTPSIATACLSEIRSCNDGNLSGTYSAAQCGQLIVIPFSPTITIDKLGLSRFFPYTVTSISSNPFVSISGLKVGDKVEYENLNNIPYGETVSIKGYAFLLSIKKPLSTEPQDIVLKMDTSGIRMLTIRVSNHMSMADCLSIEMWGSSLGGAVISNIPRTTFIACPK